MRALWTGSWGEGEAGSGRVSGPSQGQRLTPGFGLGKKGTVETEGQWKGPVRKRRPLFEGLDQASSDPSGTSDESVEIITNISAAGGQ